jgi:hypothetical protein
VATGYSRTEIKHLEHVFLPNWARGLYAISEYHLKNSQELAWYPWFPSVLSSKCTYPLISLALPLELKTNLRQKTVRICFYVYGNASMPFGKLIKLPTAIIYQDQDEDSCARPSFPVWRREGELGGEMAEGKSRRPPFPRMALANGFVRRLLLSS